MFTILCTYQLIDIWFAADANALTSNAFCSIHHGITRTGQAFAGIVIRTVSTGVEVPQNSIVRSTLDVDWFSA